MKRARRNPGIHAPLLLRWGFGILGIVSAAWAARAALKLFMRPRRLRKARSPHMARPPEQEDWIDFQGGRMKAYRWGQSGKPVVILAHGWEGDAAQFARFIVPLLDAGLAVVAVDAPAHGASPGNFTNLPHFARALRTLVESLNERQDAPVRAVVGHSFGGAALLKMLERLPPGQVEKAVIIGSPSELSDVLKLFSRTLNLNPTTEQIIRELIQERYGSPVEQVSIERIARDLSLPGLIVHDKQDLVVPIEQAERIHRSWKNSQFQVSDGLGHHRILKDAATISQIVAFVSTLNQER